MWSIEINHMLKFKTRFLEMMFFLTCFNFDTKNPFGSKKTHLNYPSFTSFLKLGSISWKLQSIWDGIDNSWFFVCTPGIGSNSIWGINHERIDGDVNKNKTWWVNLKHVSVENSNSVRLRERVHTMS
jgi:hypothetical protein